MPAVNQTQSSILSRRKFFQLAVAAPVALTSGCGILAEASSSRSTAPATRKSLFADRPFYVAHRGGGADWPEMTAYAYDQAARVNGLQALEISVCASRDGVLVCHHDSTTKRLCGVDYTIANETWRTLAPLKVTAAYTKDPSQPARPITRLDEVLEAHAATKVLYVEPKNPEAVEPLMARMIALGQPERVVWKQPINQPNFARAAAHGFGTWGYVLNEPGHLGQRLRRFAATDSIQMLGAPRTQPDAFTTNIVEAAKANGKRVMMWNIRTTDDRSRALRLGCTGLMTSDITGVMSAPI